jgi:hypothetical protein
MTYFFSLLRFVPDAARGEFINIGAIVGDGDVNDWDLRLISNFKRARAIDSGGMLPAAVSFATELSERLPGDEDEGTMTMADLHGLAATMHNIIQFTPPEPIVAADAAEALDLLSRDLLLDPSSVYARGYKNAKSAINATQRAYLGASLPTEAVARVVELETGQFRGGFDFAVHNGRAVQLVKCFSFELPDQEALSKSVMSWGWLVHELRRGGGEVRPRTGATFEASKELSVASVYVPPRSEDSSLAYDQARAIFAEVDVAAEPWTNAEPVASIAVERLALAV